MRKKLSEYKTIIGVDIETTNHMGSGSLDPFTGDIALVQISFSKDDIRLLRLNKENYKFIKELLEDENVLKIGHNFKFDTKFFIKNNIYPVEIFDTMIASEILYAGLGVDYVSEMIEAAKKDFDREEEFLFEDDILSLLRKKTKSTRFSNSLQAVLKRELNISISKDLQNSNWAEEPLSKAQIEYAQMDVKYLHALANTLYNKLKNSNLLNVFFLECQLLEVLAYMEIVGVKIDKVLWEKRMKETEIELTNLEKELKREIYQNFVKKSNQNFLFQDAEDNEIEKINLNSSLQMKNILGLENVSKQTLENNKTPIIEKFLRYKKLQKELSTYSTSYLKKLNQFDRLTSEYSQTQTATGRISSKKPNLQNVPGWFKQTIIAEDNRIPVFIDYSQVELRILAYLSEDENFIENTNSKDLHEATARKVFDIPEDKPVPKELRKKAKTVSFAIPYGVSAYGLVQRGFFDDLADAEDTILRFYHQFPRVKSFLEKNAGNAVDKKFTLDAIGRRRLYTVYNVNKQYLDNYLMEYNYINSYLQKEKNTYLKKILSYSSYQSFLKNINDEDIKLLISDEKVFNIFKEILQYKESVAAISREGKNHPIQATSASITKTALVRIFEYLRKTGKGIITLSVHDSIFFELEKDNIIQTIKDVKNIMEKSGEEIIKGYTPVDVEVGRKVELTCIACNEKYYDNQFYLDLKEELLLDRLKNKTYNFCEKCKEK